MTEVFTYKSVKTASLLRETDEQKANKRRKTLLLLVLQYLQDEGFVDASQALEKETNLDISKYDVCDNICLETILMDFEAYYHVKFNKYPNIIKKSKGFADCVVRKERKSCPLKKYRTPSGNSNTDKNCALPRINSMGAKSNTANLNENILGKTPPQSIDNQEKIHQETIMPVVGQSFKSNNNNNNNNKNTNNFNNRQNENGYVANYHQLINEATKDTSNWEEDKFLKPLGGYEGYTSEWKELAQVISKDIYSRNPDVKWTDIIGLENAKSVVKESVVYPIKFPQFFTGLLSPWKGLLLYGPSGTGKTLLAKAVATECKTTFFNISASTIVSKWRGDSEKLVRVLFELARFHAPSTIFLDEIDALMGHRGAANSEHEGSRRMKTELLVQMDGLAKTSDLVFLLAASNLPWELDPALLRRLEKRIYVGLPSMEARKKMLEHYLPPVISSAQSSGVELLSQLEYEHLAKESDGYSGSDVHVVCKEAAMRPLRKVFQLLDGLTDEHPPVITLQCVTTQDVLWALSRIKPSTKNIVERYLRWQKDFESS